MRKLSIVLFFIMAVLLSACSNADNVNTEKQQIGTFAEDQPTETAKDVALSDLDIIIKKGHPRIWDNEVVSHNIWDDVEKGKIRHPDSNSKYQEMNIVYMDSMEDHNGDIVIRDIQVYLQNFTENPNLTVDDVLPIISSYLPASMAVNYELASSFVAIPKDSQKETHYLLQYYPTEEAKANGTAIYGVAIDICVENGIVQQFRLSLDHPKWVSFLEKNGYSKEEWNYDFLAS